MPTKENIKILDKIIEIAFYFLLVAFTFSITFVEAIIGIILLSWLAKKIIVGNFAFPKHAFFVAFIFFIIWNAVSIFNSNYLYESLRGLVKVIKYGLLLVITIDTFRTRQIFKNATALLIIWSLVIAINGIVQGIIGFDLFRLRTVDPLELFTRISSSFRQSNDFGAYLVVIIPIYLSYIFSKGIKLKSKIYFLFGFFLLFFCLIRTYSRGAWIALYLALIILGLLKSKKLFVALIVLIVILPLFLPPQIKGRTFNVLNFKEGTSWERLELWNGALVMIKIHPFLGFGVNTYTKNFPDYKPKSYWGIVYPHNCYLQMATEIGLIGLSLFLSFIILSFIYIGRHLKFFTEIWMKNITIGLFSSLIGFLIHSAVDTHLYSVNLAVMFYLLLGFCIAICNYAKYNPA